MSLISRICLGFIIWTVGGALLYMLAVAYHVSKCRHLDPSNEEILDEYEELAMDEAFRKTGVPQKPGSGRRRDPDEAKVDLYFIAAMAMAGMVWPLMLWLVNTGYPIAYQKLKDEYDRGIRVRKEPS